MLLDQVDIVKLTAPDLKQIFVKNLLRVSNVAGIFQWWQTIL